MAPSKEATAPTGRTNHINEADAVCVKIPDLFSSVMATPLRVNPHYFSTVREEGYERIKTLMKKDAVWSAKNASVELGFLCSTWVPTAGADALRTFFDYNHWVFLFDDRMIFATRTVLGPKANVGPWAEFDEGHLRCDPAAAFAETRKMSAIMEGSLQVVEEDDMNPIRYLWQTVCDRVRQGSSEGK